MSATPSYDESIPVLTEVVAEPAVVTFDVPAAPEAPAADDDAWRALEERLVARVLERLQDRVDAVLADQVRASMAPILDHLATRLAAELRDGLQQTVEQIVTRAVAQELAHLRPVV